MRCRRLVSGPCHGERSGFGSRGAGRCAQSFKMELAGLFLQRAMAGAHHPACTVVDSGVGARAASLVSLPFACGKLSMGLAGNARSSLFCVRASGG